MSAVPLLRPSRAIASWSATCAILIGAATRFVHSPRRLHPRGEHGGRLFHGARAERSLPAAQRRGIGDRLCFVFLYFWVAGGGEWSLDRLRAPASALSPSRA